MRGKITSAGQVAAWLDAHKTMGEPYRDYNDRGSFIFKGATESCCWHAVGLNYQCGIAAAGAATRHHN